MSKFNIKHGYRKSRRKSTIYVAVHAVAILAALGGGMWQYNLTPTTNTAEHVEALPEKQTTTITTPMPWPAYGKSAYGVADRQVVAASDKEAAAVPIASLTKVITALAVLEKKPLAKREQGPMIALNEKDVELYNEYSSKQGSVVLVAPGEQISQYQALQAMLLPSANNIADTLVIWAFGSVENYVEYANKMVREMGLANTTVADASGFSPLTISTPEDMVKVGTIYIKNPLLREIAAQPEANIPIAGMVPNYNSYLNKGGLLGIKVGYTDEAGRCFMLANVRRNGPEEIVSVSVVLGADHINAAMLDAERLINAGDAGFDDATRGE